MRAIYGFTDGGDGYEVFKPGNRFNSLAALAQDGTYILDVAQPGFELPGAVQAVPYGSLLPAPVVTIPATSDDGSLRLLALLGHTPAGGAHTVLTVVTATDNPTNVYIGADNLSASPHYITAGVASFTAELDGVLTPGVHPYTMAFGYQDIQFSGSFLVE